MSQYHCLALLGTKAAAKTSVTVRGSGKLHALDELADGAHPVRAFNTLGWENFADAIVGGVPADLFYAAEEGVAKDTAETLILDIGLEPV